MCDRPDNPKGTCQCTGGIHHGNVAAFSPRKSFNCVENVGRHRGCSSELQANVFSSNQIRCRQRTAGAVSPLPVSKQLYVQ